MLKATEIMLTIVILSALRSSHLRQHELPTMSIENPFSKHRTEIPGLPRNTAERFSSFLLFLHFSRE